MPTVLVIAGLTGSSESPYVQRLAKHLRDMVPGRRLRIALYSARGRGSNPITTPFLYSAGYTEDIRRVVKHILAKHTHSTLIGVGYSLGANALAKYLGEEGSSCKLAGAVCCSCPIDLL